MREMVGEKKSRRCAGAEEKRPATVCIAATLTTLEWNTSGNCERKSNDAYAHTTWSKIAWQIIMIKIRRSGCEIVECALAKQWWRRRRISKTIRMKFGRIPFCAVDDVKWCEMHLIFNAIAQLKILIKIDMCAERATCLSPLVVHFTHKPTLH